MNSVLSSVSVAARHIQIKRSNIGRKMPCRWNSVDRVAQERDVVQVSQGHCNEIKDDKVAYPGGCFMRKLGNRYVRKLYEMLDSRPVSTICGA
jgi:hypothetical protein